MRWGRGGGGTAVWVLRRGGEGDPKRMDCVRCMTEERCGYPCWRRGWRESGAQPSPQTDTATDCGLPLPLGPYPLEAHAPRWNAELLHVRRGGVAGSTKLRKKIGSSVAYKTIGTFLSKKGIQMPVGCPPTCTKKQYPTIPPFSFACFRVRARMPTLLGNQAQSWLH